MLRESLLCQSLLAVCLKFESSNDGNNSKLKKKSWHLHFQFKPSFFFYRQKWYFQLLNFYPSV